MPINQQHHPEEFGNQDTVDKDVLQKFTTAHQSLEYFRLQWVDFSGILRTRILTKTHCLQLAAGERSYGLGPSCMLCPVSGGGLAELPIQRRYELQPDWSSLRLCQFAPGHASVMCFVYCHDAESPFSQCPRHLLNSVLQGFQENQESKVLVGFEIEFVLLDALSNIPSTVDPIGGISVTAGLRGDTLVLLEEIVSALEASDIAVYHFHTEAQHQLEVSTEPMAPMQAIDALMYTHETIKAISVRHGVKATMTPRPVLQGATNGNHLHLSVNPLEAQDSFLAGILEKLPVLSAFGMPNYDSYVRLKDSEAACGPLVSWGTENRGVPIRKVDAGRWEFRCVDATANLYLFLAVTLAAGLAGVRECRELRWKDCRRLPSALNEETLALLGITEHLPSSLKEALELLKEDSDLEGVMGGEMKRLYHGVKEVDVNILGRISDEERRLYFLRYF